MKKQKKGFTLIELLATIIILGLLVTIAYISVTSILNRGNDSYYKSQENMLLLAGREYFADHRSELPKDIGNTSNVSLETLIKEGVVVDAVIADPPYGTTACKWDSIIPFEPLWEKLNKITKETGAFVLFGSEPFSSTLRFSNIKN